MKGIILSELLNTKQEDAPKLKPIEVTQCLDVSGGWNAIVGYKPHKNEKFILLQKHYFVGKDDLFLGFLHHESVFLYRGQWNDGVTE